MIVHFRVLCTQDTPIQTTCMSICEGSPTLLPFGEFGHWAFGLVDAGTVLYVKAEPPFVVCFSFDVEIGKLDSSRIVLTVEKR